MQKISEFHDVQLTMDVSGNRFPEVRAIYNRVTGVFSIESGKLIDVLNGEMDDFPMKQERLITAWILIHRDELLKYWQALLKDKNAKLNRIAPLQ